MYSYKIEVLRVVDADTIDARIDLGFRMYTVQRIRLAGVDAWEMRGPEKLKGRAATRALIAKLQTAGPWTVATYKTGKFGRWLGTIENAAGENVNDWLVAAGHAIRKEY